MSDLVERLRALGQDSVGNYGMPVAIEAADEIERLRAERDSFYMDYRMKCDEQTKALHVEVERLRAERDALRGKLDKIIDTFDSAIDAARRER